MGRVTRGLPEALSPLRSWAWIPFLAQAQRLLDVRPIFVAAYRQLMLETDADIFDALWRIEAALIEKPFAKRLTV